MSTTTGRREFLRAAAVTSAGLALAKRLPAAPAKSVLVFTKSSGFEHEVVKRIDGKPSLMDDTRSEEHTSELQSRGHLVCRLLLEKKKTNTSARCHRPSGRGRPRLNLRSMIPPNFNAQPRTVS